MNRTQAQPAPPRLLPRRVWDRIEAHHDALADPQRVRRAARQLKALAARCRLSWRRDQPGHLDVRNCWDGRDVDVLRDRLMNTRNGSAIDLAPALLDAGRLAVPADVAAPWRHLGREETVLAMDHRGMVLVRIRETVVPMDAPPHLRTRYRTPTTSPWCNGPRCGGRYVDSSATRTGATRNGMPLRADVRGRTQAERGGRVQHRVRGVLQTIGAEVDALAHDQLTVRGVFLHDVAAGCGQHTALDGFVWIGGAR